MGISFLQTKVLQGYSFPENLSFLGIEFFLQSKFAQGQRFPQSSIKMG